MASAPIRRIAICTGGGDAPGLNAVISSVVWSAMNRGWDCVGIRDGFNGMPARGYCNDCSDATYAALIAFMSTSANP